MKKNLLFLPLFLLLAFFAGCQKEVDTTDPPAAMTFSVVANPAQISAGESSLIVIKSSNTDSIISDLPGATYIVGSADKSIETPSLVNPTTYHFRFYKNGIVKFENVSIGVKMPPVVTISASVVDLPKGGGKTKITINAKNANTVSFNGSGYTVFPVTFETDWLCHDSTFVFLANGDGGNTTATITITVVPPTEQELLLSSGPWVVTKIEGSYYTPDGPWTECPDLIGCKMTFYLFPPKIKSESSCSEGICTYWSDWFLNGSLLTGFGDRTILFLTEDKMITLYESISIRPDGAIPWFVKETYQKLPNP